jgi:competence protein ComEA
LGVIGPHVTFGGAVGQQGGGAVVLAPLSASLAAPAAPLPLRAAAPPALLDLNSATAAALDSLPGIGPARARAIVEFRTRHGSFSTVDDLGQVPGFGPAALARVRDRVSVR